MAWLTVWFQQARYPPRGCCERRTALFDIEIDYSGGSKAIVYAAMRGEGVQLLRFDPNAVDILEELTLVQTPGNASSVHLRTLPGSGKQLVVSDYEGGIRLYGPETQQQ